MSLIWGIFVLKAFAFQGLEVREIRESYLPYEEFCVAFQEECDLENSASEIQFSDENSESIFEALREVNMRVNETLLFALDSETYEREEKWSLPLSGVGDCEDNALVKRKILVEDYGLPRGALRMATGFHNEKFYSHAVLAVNTSKGVFILDQDQTEVLFWKKSPYIFESLELPGRKWARFYQEW